MHRALAPLLRIRLDVREAEKAVQCAVPSREDRALNPSADGSQALHHLVGQRAAYVPGRLGGCDGRREASQLPDHLRGQMGGEHQSFWRPRTVVPAVEQGMLCGRLFVCRKPVLKLLLDLRALLCAPLFAPQRKVSSHYLISENSREISRKSFDETFRLRETLIGTES